MTSLTKNLHPPGKLFFECNLLDWPIRWAIEQLSSAIGGEARTLVRQPKTAVFLQKSPKPPRCQGVKQVLTQGSSTFKKIMFHTSSKPLQYSLKIVQYHYLSSFTEILNTLASAKIQGFSEKKTPKHTWLCAGIALVQYALQTRQSLKRRGKSSSLHSKKNFLLGVCRFFVSDIVSGGLFGHLGPLCLTLGANR